MTEYKSDNDDDVNLPTIVHGNTNYNDGYQTIISCNRMYKMH